MVTGTVKAAVRVKQGGVALIADQVGAGHALAGELSPGAAARIVRLDGDQEIELCSGMPVDVFDPTTPRTATLVIDGSGATLSLDDRVLATCAVATAPSDRGAWGVAAFGAGAQVDVVTITVSH
jgi:hypothetical protein